MANDPPKHRPELPTPNPVGASAVAGESPVSARDEAERAIQADARGEAVDYEGLARRTLLDVLARGEDKDRVAASKAFLAFQSPKKAKEEPEKPGEAPAWTSDPEAAKPVVGGGEGQS